MDPIRGEEAVIGIGRRGTGLELGSLVEISDWELKPDVEIKKRSIIGAKTKKGDVQFHGWDFSFSCHVKDSGSIKLMFDVIAREQQDKPPEEIYVWLKLKYRGAPEGEKVITLSKVVLAPGAMGAGREDYLMHKFEVFAEQAV